MREIKFRGKRLKDEEWITGDLITETDSDMKVERSFIHLRLSPISFTDDALSSTICLHEVDPETVVEYTGLKDRNGKEIWEGDVLKGKRFVSWSKKEERLIGQVVYRPTSFQLDGVGKYKGINCEEFNPLFEIIGNIYENPELLTKED